MNNRVDVQKTHKIYHSQKVTGLCGPNKIKESVQIVMEEDYIGQFLKVRVLQVKNLTTQVSLNVF